MEMNNITTTTQVDRTSLYLMAIYVIHGILLHVLLMNPQLDGTAINWNILTIGIPKDRDAPIVNRNSNDSKTGELNISYELTDGIKNWSDVNSDHNHVHRDIIMTSEFSCQKKFLGTAICYSALSEYETSVVKVMSCGSTMLMNMSPAVLGIILGCMVFLFTDNINIP